MKSRILLTFWHLALAGCMGGVGGGQDADPAQTSPADDAALQGLPDFDAGPPGLGPLPVQDDASPLGTTDPGLDSGGFPPSSFPYDGGAACTTGPAAGDLVIDELMVESVSGTGDYGEWLEVRSTRSCALDLRGLHGDAPSGAKVRTFDVGADLWVDPYGSFVVADSSNPAINHDLPGLLVEWSGQPGDVLRNKGGTVDLWMGETLVDTITFPSLKLVVGASVEFPADCDPSLRGDFTVWQTSTTSFFPGFYGTPNSPNMDVTCPLEASSAGASDAGE